MSSKFTAQRKADILNILIAYDPFDVLPAFSKMQPVLRVAYWIDEYKSYVNKIIREADYDLTHDEMWDICEKVLQLDELSYNKHYDMVEELMYAFVDETRSKNRTLKRTKELNLKDELKRIWVEKIYHPDNIDALLESGMDIDDAWEHIDTTLGFA